MKILFLTVFSLPLLAVALDFIFGDPQHLPHPVRFIGRWLEWLEPRARNWKLNLRMAGRASVLLTVALTALAVHLLSEIRYIGMIFAVYFAYAGLALGELIDDGRDALDLIEAGDLDGAREAVGMLVTRETDRMDAAELRRTLAETVSENLSDGFFGPLFYLVLGGPVLMWIYKAVSTMDSMWGYKTEEYGELGRAAARTDDLLSWIPARLTAFFLLVTGWLLRMPWREAKRNLAADARKMESPNAGWPMATCAWLLEGSMGGPAVYFGEAKWKPNLGPQDREWTPEKLKNLFRLAVFAAFLGLFVMQGLYVGFSMFFG
jgi:adenosylcobinamide-phosphate synthase